MLDNFHGWLMQPFSSSMSAPRWIAFAGLIVAALVFWGFVLKRIENA